MAAQSPYRSLPPARRAALVAHVVAGSREGRAHYVQRLVARGGGFRAVTVQAWPAERLAREVVRLGAEEAQDERDLLQMLYVELEPGIQATFLDAAGVRHENGAMPEDLVSPYADPEAVRRGAAAVRERHGDDGERYLRTLARYARDDWPGVGEVAGEAAR